MSRKIALAGFILGLCISNYDYVTQAVPISLQSRYNQHRSRVPSTKPTPGSKVKPKLESLWFPTMVVYKELGNLTSLNLDVAGYLIQLADQDLSLQTQNSLSSLSKFTNEETLAAIVAKFSVQGVPAVSFSLPVKELGLKVFNSSNITVQFNDTTDRNGFFKAKLSNLTIEGQVGEGNRSYFLSSELDGIHKVQDGTWIFTKDEGFSIITDLDDTIKETKVHNAKELFENTFVSPDKAAEGAASLFSLWASELKNETSVLPTFHYISGSPWPLYSSIQSFINKNKFPVGTVDMRGLNMTRHKEFFDLGDSTSIETYRLNRIFSIMSTLPQKQFVLIGDSTQRDAEIYAKIFKHKTRNVKCIFIRQVSGVNEEKEEILNKPRRFEKIFEDVPADSWFVFKDFAELEKVKFASATCRPTQRMN